MSPLLADMLGAVLRWGLTLAVTALVTRHVIDADQGEAVTQWALDHLPAVMAVLLPLAWSLWRKYGARLRLIAAADLPAGATDEQIRAQAQASTTKAAAFQTLAVLLIVAGLESSACASLPIKQNAVASLAASETALEGAHNIERILCSPTADQSKPIRHCDGAQAAQVGLTDDVHKRLALIFAEAFDSHERAASVLRAWKANDPPPSTVGDYLRVASQALSVVRQQVPSATDLMTKLQLAVDNAAMVAQIVGAGATR